MGNLPVGFKKGLLFVVCSSVISGCSSFNFYGAESPCENCSEPALNNPAATNIETTKAVAEQDTNISDATNSTTLLASSEETKAGITPSTETAFKGPKALQDIQAISLDVNHGYSNQKTASAASVFIKETPQDSTKVDLKKNTSTPEVVVKVDQAEPVSVVTAIEKSIEPESNTQVISSVEEINRLTEETPTAAGIETRAVLDVPKVTEPVKQRPVSQIASSFTTSNFGIWKIEKNWDGKHPGVCRLSTSTIQIDQHDYTTQLWFNVVGGKLLVNSTTNIDIKQSGVGIKADNGKLQRFAEKIYSSNVVWSGNLAETLKSNDELTIILGGSELGKNTHEASIDLQGLKKGYSAYQACKG